MMKCLKRCCMQIDHMILFFSSSRPVDVSAIDHLPSVLPRESSERFANKMTSYLLKLDKVRNIIETTEHNLIGGANVSAS